MMDQPVPPGTEYSYDLPPPPGVDNEAPKGYYGDDNSSHYESQTSSRDYDRQRDRDRSRRRDRSRNKDYNRHERDNERNRHYEDYDGYYDEGYGDSRDYYGDESYGPESDRTYGNRRDSYGSYSDRGDDYGEWEERRGRRDRDRYRERDRERFRDRDRYHDRERDRVRSRERDREHSRDRDRDWDRERDRNRERDWREEIPNSTIMVKGLANHVSEADIRNEVLRYGLEPKDIRLMRKKETGTSRGFAFVEFPLLSEAVRWKELTQGVILFDGQYRATLHYSIPKDTIGAERGLISKADWTCSKCGVNNFRRRDLCFKCNSPREEAEVGRLGGEGYDEISSTATNTLLFRNLDILTTEERVLSMLGQLTVLPIKSLKVAKDPLTNTSRGFAFVELHTTSEATQLYDLLLSMEGNFYVDGRQVTVSYARRSLTAMNSAASANAASVALAAAQWTNQGSEYGADDQYYNQSGYQNSDSAAGSLNNETGAGTPDQAQASGAEYIVVDGVSYRKYAPPNVSSYQYDQSSGYYYDSTTGLYYDPNSQYYYNSQTQQYLYWDGEKQTYLPASVSTSGTQETSVVTSAPPCTTTSPVAASAQLTVTTSAPPVIEQAPMLNINKESEANQEKGKEKEKGGKGDKVKIAKKIAKDMEKWAKTLNQKKDIAKVAAPSTVGLMLPPSTAIVPQSSTADLAFTVLQKKPSGSESAQLFEITKKKAKDCDGTKAKAAEPLPLVAAYGDGSDSEPEGDAQDEGTKAFDLMRAEELKLTDWIKLACLLCKRQFPSKEALMKHQQLSDLHKQNMDILRLTTLSPMQLQELEKKEREAGYRDRAKERREKFGQPDQPPPNRLKTKFLKQLEEQTLVVPETPNKDGIGSDNIGNKMLKAMGWTEGQGLGKSGQGMSGIIEVQQRVKCAGLGMKGSSYGATAGDSYKDAVKKAMQARYKELS